jgi:hypothetical protein
MIKKYFGHEFIMDKYSALDGKTKVCWIQKSTDDTPLENAFVVEVDSAGMRFRGNSPTIQTTKDLRDWAKMIDDVWREHLKLAPELYTTPSGHR